MLHLLRAMEWLLNAIERRACALRLKAVRYLFAVERATNEAYEDEQLPPPTRP